MTTESSSADEIATPRCDEMATDGWSGDAVCVPYDFAQSLEREAVLAVAKIAELERKQEQDRITINNLAEACASHEPIEALRLLRSVDDHLHSCKFEVGGTVRRHLHAAIRLLRASSETQPAEPADIRYCAGCGEPAPCKRDCPAGTYKLQPAEPSGAHQLLIDAKNALAQACGVANEAREYLDRDNEMKCMKLLIALSGHLPKYKADIDRIHEVLKRLVEYAERKPSETDEGRQCECPKLYGECAKAQGGSPRGGGVCRETRKTQLAESHATSQTMRIAYDVTYRTIWHEDCAVSPPGIMREVERKESHTLMECLACKLRGYYPVGGSGVLCVEVVDEPQNTGEGRE